MLQAESFYLRSSECICGLTTEAGGGEARRLASGRVQLGGPRNAHPGRLLVVLHVFAGEVGFDVLVFADEVFDFGGEVVGFAGF